MKQWNDISEQFNETRKSHGLQEDKMRMRRTVVYILHCTATGFRKGDGEMFCMREYGANLREILGRSGWELLLHLARYWARFAPASCVYYSFPL